VAQPRIRPIDTNGKKKLTTDQTDRTDENIGVMLWLKN